MEIDLVGGANLLDDAVIHDCDSITEAHCLHLVMGHVHACKAGFSMNHAHLRVGDQIYAAEEAGALPPGTALGLVRVLFRGGFDTTIAGSGATLEQLSRNPAQWDLLRADPGRAAGAFTEALRHASPAQLMFRTTVSGGAELGGQRLEGDTKIAAFIGAANRDPLRWDRPEVFDIARDNAGHLAFGAGAHVCLGLMIAKLEAEAVLSALARRVRRLEPDGEAQHRLVNTLRTHARLPLRVSPVWREELMPKANFILVDDTSRALEVPEGTSLMVAATHAGLKDIVAECGGAMSCASCHVMVEPAYWECCPPKSAAEDQMLDFTVAPRAPGSRLSCQLIMAEQMDGITVRVADAQV